MVQNTSVSCWKSGWFMVLLLAKRADLPSSSETLHDILREKVQAERDLKHQIDAEKDLRPMEVRVLGVDMAAC